MKKMILFFTLSVLSTYISYIGCLKIIDKSKEALNEIPVSMEINDALVCYHPINEEEVKTTNYSFISNRFQGGLWKIEGKYVSVDRVDKKRCKSIKTDSSIFHDILDANGFTDRFRGTLAFGSDSYVVKRYIFDMDCKFLNNPGVCNDGIRFYSMFYLEKNKQKK